MATLAQVNARIDAAVAAIDAADYATAETQALAAQALLAGIPDTEKDGSVIRFQRQSIQEMLGNIRRLRSAALGASAGIQQSHVTYARPDASDEY